jgi:DNA helicase-2/ATP-dependent DNA helicase PcrA
MTTSNTQQDSMLAGLNDKQLEAVTLPAQSALILAGAGSGKTRVLTTRIAWLIQTGQVSPTGLLAVTFTNKAAKEMLTRLTAMLPINTRGMWVGTFHGLCNRLLRAHYREAMLPQTFQILDTGDQLSAIKRVMKVMNVDDEKFPPKQVMGYINSCKEEGLRAHTVEAYDPHSQRMREIFDEYDKQCQREGVVDFAELLLRCYELLGRDANIRQHYQSRFRYILVDEFQDTNRLQYQWLKLLAGNDNCVFAVGDDDQSIYAFRGARVGNMRDFEKEFSIQNVVKLEQNYRSHSNILDAANAIISNNNNRLGKNLWTAAGQGEPVRVYEAYNDIDEASFIVDEVKMLHSEGWALNEITLLYRSNAQSRVIEHALFSNNIPYRVYGGLRFFERAEIKHAMAYLRLVSNSEDDVAMLRVINFPTRGIGARSLEQLQEAARVQSCSLWQAAINKVGNGKPGKGLDGFVALIKQMQDDSKGLTLPEMAELATTMSGLKSFYQLEKDGEDRIANLDELINAAVTFINNNNDALEEGSTGLLEFLTHASLEAGEHQADVGADALQLMTVHAAKGLEFQAVFISGLEEGLFPHENSTYESNGLEEERRLMYVAVTRARKRLYLSHAQSRMLHGQIRYGIPSRFLDEIPDELLKRLNSRQVQKPNMANHYNTSYTTTAQSSSQQSSMPWKIGQAVLHAKFGQGVVVSYEGNANDMRVQVNFGREGLKWLAMEYAKLEKV